MLKEKQFNYETKDLVHFGCRLPRSFGKTLKAKALVDDISLQDLMIYIVGNYILEAESNDTKELIKELRDKVQKVVK